MDRRTHESPMDFEWQTQPPADVTSPFYQLSQNQVQRRGFESPLKPALPRPDMTPSIFDSAANPAIPFRNPSFTTPRKPFDPEIFSEASGAESSPADNADAEDTPETIKLSKEVASFTSGLSNKKPIFGRYGAHFAGGSPGRGEIRRAKYADALSVVQKTRKRRRMERDRTLASGRRGSSDLDSETDDRRPRGRREQSSPPPSLSWLASVLSFIDSKPALPYILSYYAQLLLNYFLVGLVMYIVWCFYLTIIADVDKASEAAMGTVLAEMAQCAAQYTENRCAKGVRVPAMETLCESWETCMNRDPSHVGRARVSAHTFAEIFNSFVEPISWKAMAFVVLIIIVTFGVNNFAFGTLRSKAPQPHLAAPYYAPPSATPSHSQEYHWGAPQTPRQLSHHLDQGFYGPGMGTQFQTIMPSQTPQQRSPRKLSWD